MIRRYVHATVDAPKAAFSLVGLMFVLGATFSVDVVIDNDFRKMVIQRGGGIEFLDAHNEVFGPDDTTLTYALTPRPEDEGQFFSWMSELSQRLLERDEVLRIESPVTTAVPLSIDGGLYIGPVLGSQAPPELSRTDGVTALSESLSGAFLLSEDKTTSIVSIVLDETLKSVVDIQKPAQEIDALVQSTLADKGLEIGIKRMGIAFTRLAAVEGIRRDLGMLLPIAYLFVGLLLWRLYPRLYAVILPPSALGIACIMTVGFAARIGEPITPLSVAFPILVLVIGLGDALHMLNRFHDLRRAGSTAKAAAKEAGSTVGRACLLTTLTSSIGFASLMLTDMPILVGFGLVSSVGIWMAFLVSMTLLPAALGTVTTEPPPPPRKTSFYARSLAGLCKERRHALTLVVVAALGCIGLGYASRSITIDYHFSKILNPDHPVAQGNRLWDQAFPGLLSIDINLQGAPGTFRDPKVLQQLEAFRSEAHKTLSFSHSFGLSVLLRDINKALTNDEQLPTSNAGVAQLLLFAESRRDILETLVNFDYSRARITFSRASAGGSITLDLAHQLETRCRELLGEASQVDVRATGINVISSEGFAALVGSLIESLFGALVLIVCTMALVFRSLRVGLASIVPNTLPLVAVTGIFSILETPLELMPAVMFCIAIGIAVDDTIHFLARFLDERNRGRAVDAAVQASLEGSLGPVVDTSLIIITGFAVLVFSSFPANQTSALLGISIMVVALLSDLFIMPATMRIGWSDPKD